MTAARASLLLLGATAATALVAGCGGGGTAPTPPGFPAVGAGGDVPVEAFVRFQRSIDETWESDPVLITMTFLRPWLDGRDHAETVVVEREGTVVVTAAGLLDDSVRDERVAVAVRAVDGGYEPESATWSQRCHAGRGHQGFSPGPCV